MMSEEAIFEHSRVEQDTHGESQMVHDNEQIKKDFSKFGLNVNGKLVVKLVLALSVFGVVELFEELVAEIPFFKRYKKTISMLQ